MERISEAFLINFALCRFNYTIISDDDMSPGKAFLYFRSEMYTKGKRSQHLDNMSDQHRMWHLNQLHPYVTPYYNFSSRR